MAVPDSIDVALKEWSLVCQALATGRQSVLFRKGGLADPNGDFRLEHEWFWLYPTYLHQSQVKLKPSLDLDDAHDDPDSAKSRPIELQYICRAEHGTWVESLAAVEALQDFHVLNDEAVRTRFHYRRQGLLVVVPRLYRTDVCHRVEETIEMAGCKSWVRLPRAFPAVNPNAVLSDAEFQGCLARIRGILEGPSAPSCANR